MVVVFAGAHARVVHVVDDAFQVLVTERRRLHRIRVADGFVSRIGPFEANWEYVLERGLMASAMNPGLGGGPLMVGAVVLVFVGFLIEYAVWTLGLGGAILTRFGRRGAVTEPPMPPPVPEPPTPPTPPEPPEPPVMGL